MISRQIYRDPQKPCVHTTLATKAGPLFEGTHKAFLGQRIRGIGITHQEKDHAVNPPLMLPNQAVEIFDSDTASDLVRLGVNSQRSSHEFSCLHCMDDFERQRFTRRYFLRQCPTAS
jgi:hypothetical protein